MLDVPPRHWIKRRRVAIQPVLSLAASSSQPVGPRSLEHVSEFSPVSDAEEPEADPEPIARKKMEGISIHGCDANG